MKITIEAKCIDCGATDNLFHDSVSYRCGSCFGESIGKSILEDYSHTCALCAAHVPKFHLANLSVYDFDTFGIARYEHVCLTCFWIYRDNQEDEPPAPLVTVYALKDDLGDVSYRYFSSIDKAIAASSHDDWDYNIKSDSWDTSQDNFARIYKHEVE